MGYWTPGADSWFEVRVKDIREDDPSRRKLRSNKEWKGALRVNKRTIRVMRAIRAYTADKINEEGLQ